MASCKDCFRNCPQIITDLCVRYTGEPVDELDICTDDTLALVDAKIIDKLIGALNGTGITFADFVSCSTITTLLDGAEANLANLIQALVTNSCAVEDAIDEINTKINAPFTVSAPCLTLPAVPTRDDILKAVVVKACENDGSITTVINDYVKSSELCDRVNQCIADNNNGSGEIVQEYTKMPKYVYMAYDGPLTVFDASGKGIAALGYDKVYIGNGNNGTRDVRGRNLIGANTNVVGGTLENAVDPAQTQNAGYSITPGTKKGDYTETLSIIELPAHSAAIPASTFNIKVPGQRGGDNSDNSNTTAFAGGDKLPGDTGFNFTLTVPATVPAGNTSSVGGGQPHNNLAPSYGVVWIVYLP